MDTELNKEIARYDEVLNSSEINLEVYITLANDLDTLSKAGRINDMRRLLVVRLLGGAKAPYIEVESELKSILGAYAVEERREVSKLIQQEIAKAIIDEYKNHMPVTKYPNHYQVNKLHLDQRIAELSKTLKELEA